MKSPLFRVDDNQRQSFLLALFQLPATPIFAPVSNTSLLLLVYRRTANSVYCLLKKWYSALMRNLNSLLNKFVKILVKSRRNTSTSMKTYVFCLCISYVGIVTFTSKFSPLRFSTSMKLHRRSINKFLLLLNEAIHVHSLRKLFSCRPNGYHCH